MRTKDIIMLEQAYASVHKQQFSEMADIRYSDRRKEKGPPPFQIVFSDPSYTKEDMIKELTDDIARMEHTLASPKNWDEWDVKSFAAPGFREKYQKDLERYKRQLQFMKDYDPEKAARDRKEWEGLNDGDNMILDRSPLDDDPDEPVNPMLEKDPWELERLKKKKNKALQAQTK